MRILHVFDHSIPLHSGYTFRSAAILREQRALGWETFHLTSPKQGKASGAEEDIDGLHFFRTPEVKARTAVVHEVALMQALERRIGEVAATVRPDVIHAHSPVLNALPALRAGRRLRIPVVYEIRAFWEDAAVDHGTAREHGLRYRATRTLETWALQRVDHVFTICEGLRADIVARGIPKGRVTVIPNAVDIESFQLSGEPDRALKTKLGLDGKTVIGFVGSFYAYEGLDLLLEAVPAILSRHPELHVLLVGGGPQEENLKAQAERLGIADRVIFAGRVPHGEVSRYYDLIDLLAYPRHSMRLTELVTPLKPLEAMAQGRVFVASDVGGHKELVRDGETGRLFRAGNAEALTEAVVGMLAQRGRWGEYRIAGRQFVEAERNWRRSVDAYRAPYGRLAGAA
ncbi:TIGR04063 family PEP-CTERM/XrtA system glycosyltransferase [Azoarcus sp. KH32C]|uniref:TIGR04063 family PEP-CTERM/XrtA system glycosyltransferase n=1 Tax=Azoarcus sp. KH32C TaxID=748247 RepID=UPI0002386991|nr:TIGR04063 family PEP-CTERM/XrtA system glycosyltransferase [Azoarcus sp. KH32C]BAL25901.1 glycosyltransferase family protein [Azoarcus sp. KH32C]